MRIHIIIWILLSVLCGFEFWALARHPSLSILLAVQAHGWISKTLKISTEPGRILSLWLGWTGLGLMVIMNLYSIRKRMASLRMMGRLTTWLDFHIFCGLLGPTLIFFHCNFRVRGLVGISFWSMIVSFASGIIGRYFYLQLTSRKKEYEDNADAWKDRLKKFLEKAKIAWDDKESEVYIQKALILVGHPGAGRILNPVTAFMSSMFGDLRLMVITPDHAPKWPPLTSDFLREYAVQSRRAATLESFQKLMGYWHAFHFPFAVFMYIAAVIHVASSLLLGV